jgi:hypothetical protein
MAAAACALALALASPAMAQEDRLPEGNSGAGQYVEPVPDAGGDRPAAPGSGGGGSRAAPLPQSMRTALPPGEEGRALERIATDRGSGAPATGSARHGGGDGAGDEGALSALASAAVDSGDPTLLIVMLIGLAMMLGVAGATFRHRRRS